MYQIYSHKNFMKTMLHWIDFFWNSKNINAMHRLFWNEESKQKVDIQRTFLNKVQNLWKHAVKTAQEKLKWQRPKVKSKSQVHSMWLDIWSNDKLQQYAVAQKEEFKYGCWTRQIEADPCRLQKKTLPNRGSGLDFGKKFSSNQGRKSHYYSVPV